MDRATLLANLGNRTNDQGRGERVPLVVTYHSALNCLGKVAKRLHPMPTNSDEHRKVFPEPPLHSGPDYDFLDINRTRRKMVKNAIKVGNLRRKTLLRQNFFAYLCAQLSENSSKSSFETVKVNASNNF